MWIPKTNEELNADKVKREKDARKSGVTVTITFLIFVVFVLKFIGTKRHPWNDTFFGPTLSWAEIWNSFYFYLSMTLIFGIATYIYSRKGRSTSSLICNSCGKIKRYDKITDCDCGGHFVYLEDMKWVEDKDSDSDINNKNSTSD